MRIHRFYTPFYDFIKAAPGMKLFLTTENSDAHETDYKAILHQWKDVFNYTAGSQVLLFDGRGGEVLALIEDLGWAGAKLVVLEAINKGESAEVGGESGDTSSKGAVWLFASIVKGDNFDWIIQKTTELGVNYIVPVLSDRTIKKNINMERAKKIAVEAAEQCGRKDVPIIKKPAVLQDALKDFEEAGGKVYVCIKGGNSFLEIKDAKSKGAHVVGADSGQIGFVVGPEGGWSDREEMYFKRHSSFGKVSLGENMLRAETAAVVAVALAKI